MSLMDSALVLPAKTPEKAVIVFLHGLGDSGEAWKDKFEIHRQDINGKLPITLALGTEKTAWFDMKGLPPCDEDSTNIEISKKRIHDLLNELEEKGHPSETIVLAGFSMGGALALYAGLTYEHKLGGIGVFSAFQIQRDKIPSTVKANMLTPIYLCHGENDCRVPCCHTHAIRKLIRTFNPNVNLAIHDGHHELPPLEIRSFIYWVHQHVRTN